MAPCCCLLFHFPVRWWKRGLETPALICFSLFWGGGGRIRSRPGKPNQRKGQKQKFINFCEFWYFSLGKQAWFALNFCSGMPPGKVHELTFLWFGLPVLLLRAFNHFLALNHFLAFLDFRAFLGFPCFCLLQGIPCFFDCFPFSFAGNPCRATRVALHVSQLISWIL